MMHLPPLYPITHAGLERSLPDQIRRFGDAGFPLVQFRGKPLDAKTQWEALRAALLQSAADGGWPLIVVNDRADLAVLAAQEGLPPWGLHLGRDDFPPAEARRLPGLALLHLGTSTHLPAEWQAVDAACDHAGLGPFRATTTKDDHAEPIGSEGLKRGCAALRAAGIAPIAIGGLTMADAPFCFEAGAESLAMVSALADATNPSECLWLAQCARWRVRPPIKAGQGVLLVGGSGSGKSCLARALASRMGVPTHDLDARIEAVTGRKIWELFATEEEGAFRRLERECLPALLEHPAVVALGAGAWESSDLRHIASKSGFTVLWLAESPSVAWNRVAGDPERPLAQDRSAFMARWRMRMAHWSILPCVLPLGHTPEVLAEALHG